MTSVIAGILRKAGFRKAERVITGTRRDGNRTVNLYSWSEGFLISIDDGVIKLNHKIEYPWSKEAQNKIKISHERYLEALEQAQIRCFLNGREEIVIVEKREEKEASGLEDGNLWKQI